MRILFFMTCVMAIGLIGCATINADGSSGSLNILRYALTTPVEKLEQGAAQNSARAQYALAIVSQYGLQHTRPDTLRAAELRRKATVQRGNMPITQYTAGLNGKPGRTAIINVPRYDVSIYEGKVNDNCAYALSANHENEDAFRSCQGEVSYRAFKRLWDLANAG